jgi:hypothetical protein
MDAKGKRMVYSCPFAVEAVVIRPGVPGLVLPDYKTTKGREREAISKTVLFVSIRV